MPLSDAALDKAAKDLEQVELESFKATPATILPFGQSELRWRAKAPTTVQFKLDNHSVPRVGSQVVRPFETRTFKLTAHAGPLSTLLGQVTVAVDLGACTTIVLSEALVQEGLSAVVEDILTAMPQLRSRAAPFVDVTPQGIVLRLRFEIEVACSRNPDFDIDALIGLRIEGQEIVPLFRSFQGSLDYSALEDALNTTIGAFLGFGPQLAIAIAEDNAQSDARRAILAGVRPARGRPGEDTARIRAERPGATRRRHRDPHVPAGRVPAPDPRAAHRSQPAHGASRGRTADLGLEGLGIRAGRAREAQVGRRKARQGAGHEEVEPPPALSASPPDTALELVRGAG
jgi:hypothetical protein